METKKKELLLLVTVTLLALCVSDVLIGLYFWRNDVIKKHYYHWRFAQAAARTGEEKGFDMRSRAEILSDLRREGQVIYPAISAADFRTDEIQIFDKGKRIQPLSGISNSKSLLSIETRKWIVYESDRYGFNNPPQLGISDTEFAFVGDSFVHGMSVDTQDTVAGWFNRKGFNARSFGLTSNGPLRELATIREFVAPLRPKTVFWMYYSGNDFTDLYRELRQPILPDYLKPGFSQSLRSIQSVIDVELKRFVEKRFQVALENPPFSANAIWNSFTDQLLPALKLRQWRELLRRSRKTSEELQALRRAASPELRDVFTRILEMAKREVADFGGKFYFVYLPTWAELAEKEPSANRKFVLETAAKLDISSIDLLPKIEALADPLSMFPYRLPAHYTAEGYGRVADWLIAEIKEHAN